MIHNEEKNQLVGNFPEVTQVIELVHKDIKRE